MPTRTLHYKRARFQQSDSTIQHLLGEALDQVQLVSSRMEELNPQESTKRFINSHRNQMGMLFGNLIVYSANRNQHLLAMAEDVRELDVRQMAPPPVNGIRSEILQSILYFGIRDNHVVLLQSAGLRARGLEAYLNWLMGETTRQLSDDDGVLLVNQETQDAQDMVRRSSVKAARLRFPMQGRIRAGQDHERAVSVSSTLMNHNDRALTVLSGILGNSWLQEIRLEDALIESPLRVTVEVSYERRISDTGQTLLDDLATSFRHLDEDEIEIDLKRGGKLKGTDLRIFDNVSVATHGGLVDQSDLFTKMHGWLLNLLEQGILPP